MFPIRYGLLAAWLLNLGHEVDMREVWSDMGYITGNGRDMTSVMYRIDGPPIHEQTLGSADAMLLRLLDGDESMGGTKQPYDPRIHFVLIRDAYLDANLEIRTCVVGSMTH